MIFCILGFNIQYQTKYSTSNLILYEKKQKKETTLIFTSIQKFLSALLCFQ